MSLPNEVTSLLAGGAKKYEISRSLRFNPADSAYMNRTLSASDTKKWTWSGWLKRSLVTNGGYQTFFSAGPNSSNFDYIGFNSSPDDNRLIFGIVAGGGDAVRVSTTRLFRDFSAWYHIIVVYDSAQATSTDRVKIYINGTQETSFFETTYPSQNGVSFINGATAHNLGRLGVLATRYFGGYLTEINFVDGQALTPSSFGETDPVTGVWIPKRYTGTYGTNGFYLSFANNTSTTTLGYDDGTGIAGSGAGSNDWTVNNFSVTAGVGNDSLTDTPTDNYATINSIGSGTGTFVNGNLDYATPTGATGHGRSTIAIPKTGKWYCEILCVTASASDYIVGIVGASTNPISYGYTQTPSYSYTAFGEKVENGAFTASWGTSYTTNDLIGIAVDMDALTLVFYKNNVAQPTLNITSDEYHFMITDLSGSRTCGYTANFGQRPFTYTPPSGHKALNTANLPTPTILKPSQYMNIVTWTGTGATRSITGVGFQPDLVWSKSRSNAETHKLVDSTRGATKALSSETTGDEVTESGITSFDSDGFTIDGATDTGYNTNTYTYVGWNWKKGVTPGFDIVTYTGNGSARTISHSLGVAPKMMIVKARTTASTDQGWAVYHASNTTAPETDYLLLNSTAATADLNTVWNDTAPTSSVFSVGTNALVNTNNDTYIAYLFAEIEGFSKFGSYTGNGSTDGPFVWCGFRPKLVVVKRTDSADNWFMTNANVNPYNVISNALNTDNALQETSGGAYVDYVSNGFKVRETNSGRNGSGGTYVFAAFAENPFKYSLAR